MTRSTAARAADFLFGDAGDDLIIGGGGADRIQGGTGNDIFQLNTTGYGTEIEDGAGDSDLLQVTGTTGNDAITIRQDGQDKVAIAFASGGQFKATQVESLMVDAGMGADNITVEDLKNSAVTNVTLDVGRQATKTSTRTVIVNNKGNTDPADDDTREEPVYTFSPDRSRDTVLIKGDSGADTFTLEDNEDGVMVKRSGRQTYSWQVRCVANSTAS